MEDHTTPLAIEHYRAGRRDQALAVAIEVLKRAPQDKGALNLAGAVLFEMGRADDAVGFLSRLVAVDADFLEGRINLAVVLQSCGRLPEAAAQLRVVITLAPGALVPYSRLGSILHNLGDVTGALRSLRHALRIAPDDADQAAALGVGLLSQGVHAEATEVLAACLALRPDHGDARVHLAQAWLSLGRPDRAEAVLAPLLAPLPAGEPGRAEARQAGTRARLYQGVAGDAARTEGLPDGIVVRAPFSVLSGYGDFAQHFVCGLMERGATLRLLGLQEDESWRPSFGDPILQAAAGRLGNPVRPRLALSFLTPPLVEPIPGVPTVNYTMFEGPSVPASWAEINKAHRLVVVPTESSRLAWMAAGYPEDRLRVCPPGIKANPADEAPLSRGILAPTGRPVADYRVRVLNISDYVARKNIDGLLRVWLRATRADDDAILILKVGKGGSALGQELARLVERTTRAVGRRLEEAAPVALFTARYDEGGIAALYGLSTHYLSLSHGEGWDLPMTRAGAKGAGLIAPRHSAYDAYLDDRVAHMIPTALGPALMPYSQAYYPPFHGLDWWHPDEDAAVEILARVIADPEGERRDARRHLLERFSWQRATDTLLGVLDEVGR